MKKFRYNHGGRHQSFVPLIILVSLVAMLVGMSAFFRVTDVTVSGTSYYTQDQVAEASGIRMGTSLMMLSPSKTALKICSGLMFVKEVRIDKVYPGTVQIVVTESMPVAYCRDNTDFWTLDSDGQVLEQTTSDQVDGLIGVRGVSLPVFESGKPLGSEKNPEIAKTVGAVLQALLKREYAFTPVWIDVTDTGHITVNCGDTYTLALGSADKLDEKLALADAVVARQSDGQAGTIDVSATDAAHFIPKSGSGGNEG